jgi:hypothetical protein
LYETISITKKTTEALSDVSKEVHLEVNVKKTKNMFAAYHQTIGQNYCIKVAKNSFDGCETWSLTLREEHRLRVFENRVLRIIFGPKRDEVTGEWRKLHSGELHILYSSPNIITLNQGE